MGIKRKSGSGLYLVFRLVAASNRETMPVFLTGKGTWTSRRALARKGSLAAMKSVVAKLKAAFPDVILEKCAC